MSTCTNSVHRSFPAFARCAAGIVLLAGLATTASAQDRLFIGTGEIGAFGRFGERIGDAPGPVHGRFVAGGRYVVAGQPFDVSPPVYDTSTGRVVPTPPGRVLDVDPIRARLFVKNGARLSMWDLERQVLTPLLDVLSEESFLAFTNAAYAAESQELFVWSRQLAEPGMPPIAVPPMSVVDVASGAVRTLTLDDDLATSWRPTPDGSRLAVPYGGRGTIVLYDGRTGARLAAHYAGGSSTPFYDAQFDRWYDIGAGLTAFDRNLAPIATLPLEYPCGSAFAVSPHTSRLYVVNSIGRGGSNATVPMRAQLAVFDTATGALVGSHDVTAAAGVPPGTLRCSVQPVTVLTAPGAPRDLAATVAGRDVALSWTGVGDASNFVLDVGVAPGRTDLTFSIGSSSPATFPAVPPGTYYLRVRGTNAFGVSRPSNETVVVVP